MPLNFATCYESVMNWEKRLARELPLLMELAREAGGRVLVPACGSGGHVLALARNGFDVLGFDADEEMVEIAAQKIAAASSEIAAAHGRAETRVLTMEQASSLPAEFGAAYCLGNALPGMSAEGQVLAAQRGVAAALRPGGVFLTQNLNFDLRWQQKVSQFPILSGETPEYEFLLVKVADYHSTYINFHALFLTREKPAGKWESSPHTSRWIPLLRDLMAEIATEAGLAKLEFWGDYARTPFDPAKSNDLILVGRKR
jgi:SAM-dependent methyltransferase